YILKRLGMINENFVTVSSKIVFNISLPALIFFEISAIDLVEVLNIGQISFIYIGTLISFGIAWIIAQSVAKTGQDKASFIQGSFRGNFAIVGLAIIVNYYGIENLGKASLVLAFTIPLYNILSIIALTIPLRKEKQLNYKNTLFEIARNPLIIAVIAALPFSYLRIEIPEVIYTTGKYLSALSLPLALIGIGGFLSFSDITKGSLPTIVSTSLKLIVLPALATFAAYLLGFKGMDLGIIFILFACPTAIASFIMAEAMGANSRLAGNILLLTTLASVVTMTLGLFILKENGLI
ncbi:MAG: AEC family transporter, partial [Ignavibacteria bacterium]|nr:AEC family transporter [Ignavibacteria bacterium]